MSLEMQPMPPKESLMERVPMALWTSLAAVVVAILTSVFNLQQQGNVAGVKNQVEQTQNDLRDTRRQVEFANQNAAVAAAGSVGSLESGQKLCRVLQGRAWRDGLIVPKNWTVSLCVDYMKKTGGNGYQLGCIYSDGTNLGKEDGSFPSPNCGWQ
jgi:hypothetical protein